MTSLKVSGCVIFSVFLVLAGNIHLSNPFVLPLMGEGENIFGGIIHTVDHLLHAILKTLYELVGQKTRNITPHMKNQMADIAKTAHSGVDLSPAQVAQLLTLLHVKTIRELNPQQLAKLGKVVNIESVLNTERKLMEQTESSEQDCGTDETTTVEPDSDDECSESDTEYSKNTASSGKQPKSPSTTPDSSGYNSVSQDRTGYSSKTTESIVTPSTASNQPSIIINLTSDNTPGYPSNPTVSNDKSTTTECDDNVTPSTAANQPSIITKLTSVNTPEYPSKPTESNDKSTTTECDDNVTPSTAANQPSIITKVTSDNTPGYPSNPTESNDKSSTTECDDNVTPSTAANQPSSTTKSTKESTEKTTESSASGSSTTCDE